MNMVRINKNALPDAQIKHLHKQLDRMISGIAPEKMGGFLQGLLGPEERLMLAKRLAVIVMLKEGYSDYRIAETLKLSPSTIHNIKVRQNKNSFAEVTKTITDHKETYIAILEIVDSLLHVGGILPHRNGLDRYKKLGR